MIHLSPSPVCPLSLSLSCYLSSLPCTLYHHLLHVYFSFIFFVVFPLGVFVTFYLPFLFSLQNLNCTVFLLSLLTLCLLFSCFSLDSLFSSSPCPFSIIRSLKNVTNSCEQPRGCLFLKIIKTSHSLMHTQSWN